MSEVLQFGWHLVTFVLLYCIYMRLIRVEKKLDNK
jgi:hypothetical protein